MSIAIKKFLSMLDQELASTSEINDAQKMALKKVCEKIYLLETTVDSSLMPTQIRGEIKSYSKDFEG